MLVCDPEDAHCGYGGVDTSPEAYADPSPLAIIGVNPPLLKALLLPRGSSLSSKENEGM